MAVVFNPLFLSCCTRVWTGGAGAQWQTLPLHVQGNPLHLRKFPLHFLFCFSLSNDSYSCYQWYSNEHFSCQDLLITRIWIIWEWKAKKKKTQGELAQVQWVSLHMQGESLPLRPCTPCPNPSVIGVFLFWNWDSSIFYDVFKSSIFDRKQCKGK